MSVAVCQDFLALVLVASLLSVLVSSQTSGDAVLDFDCRRHTADCRDSAACDVSTGECDCAVTSSFSVRDYKCGDNSESGTCTSTCENSAVCVSGLCNCPESYYGERCHMNRVQVNCDGANMFLNVYPDVSVFQGKIFVLEYETEGCTLTTQAPTNGDYIENASDLQGYNIILPHAGSGCGDVIGQRVGNGSDAYTSYTREFMVRYNNNFITSVDQKVTAECRVSEGSSTIYSHGAATINKTGDVYNDVTVNTDVETVTMNLHHGDGSRIDGSVVLGDDIQLVFQLAPASGYKDFYITSCTANNTDPDESTAKKLEFISDKCPSSEAFSLFRSSLTKEPATSDTDPVYIRLDMKAFMFMGSFNEVAFVCDIVLCEETGDTNCQPGQCDGVVASKNATNNEAEVDDVTESTDDVTQTTDVPSGIFDDDDDTASNVNNGTDNQTGNQTANNQVEDVGNQTDNTVTGNSTVDDVITDTGNSTVNETSTSTGNNTETDTGSNDGTDTDTGSNDVSEGGARRKRSASQEHQEAYAKMTVIAPGGLQEKDVTKLKNSVSTTDCLEEPEILACIAILSTAVVILLTVAVMLTFNQMRNSPRHRAIRKQADADSQPHVECLRIPRLEMSPPYNNMTNQRC